MIELGWDEVLAFRLARHGLDRRRRLSGPDVARRINGIQAQVMSAAGLSIGARSSSESPARVQDELWERRTLVKTWAMRTTLTVTEFRKLSPRERRGLALEVERLGHFLGASVTLG